MTTPALKRLLLSAARSIYREAETLRESCHSAALDKDWACDDLKDCAAGRCPSEKSYAKEMRLVVRLRKEAARA